MGHAAATYYCSVTQISSLATAYSSKYTGEFICKVTGYIVNFIPFPKAFRDTGTQEPIPFLEQGILEFNHAGKIISVTNRARTIVDMMQLEEFAGGVGEILDSFSAYEWEGNNWWDLCKYIDMWDDTTLNQRISYLLYYARDYWNVPDGVINAIQPKISPGMVRLFWHDAVTNYIAEWDTWTPDLEQILLYEMGEY